jgi:hypothetical protein
VAISHAIAAARAVDRRRIGGTAFGGREGTTVSEAQGEWVRRVLGVSIPEAAPPVTSPAGPSPLQMWLDAKEAAGSQVGALQVAMRALDHPLFERLADQGLNGVTGRLQVGLQAALMDVERATGQARVAARQKARSAVAEFRGFLTSDPVVPLLDANPLGVPVSLRAGLGRALDTIDRTLAA